MPKNSSAARRQDARRLAAAEGISYTAALRRLTGQDAGQDVSRTSAMVLLEQWRQHPVEVQGCQACRHVYLAHYGSTAGRPGGCVECENTGQACPVYVPDGTPKLSSHVSPASDDPMPCPWLCGHGMDEHAEASGCYRCGCQYGRPGAAAPDEITYHGYPAGGPGARLVVIEAPAGCPVSLLPHMRGHAGTEFAWGYGGSGPAELARCLLLAVLGPAAACPACHGAARMVIGEDGREVPCGSARADEADPAMVVLCQQCDDGYRAVPHQKFKAQVVAAWDQDAEWSIDRVRVITWLRDTAPQLAAAAEAWPGST
jgi:hypothetical protein